MQGIAQIGLSEAAHGLTGLLILITWIIASIPFLFLLTWYAPELVQLMRDVIVRRDLLEEFDEQREMEGRLFDPRFAPTPGISRNHIESHIENDQRR